MRFLWCLLSIIVISRVNGYDEYPVDVVEDANQNGGNLNGGILGDEVNSFNSPEDHPFFWNVVPDKDVKKDDGALGEDNLSWSEVAPSEYQYLFVDANGKSLTIPDDEIFSLLYLNSSPDDTNSENIPSFNSLGDDALSWLNRAPDDTLYIENANKDGSVLEDFEKGLPYDNKDAMKHFNELFNRDFMQESNAKQDEISSYTDKKDFNLPEETAGKQNVMYEVDYPQPNFYDYSQLLFNKNSDLEGKIANKIDDYSNVIFVPEVDKSGKALEDVLSDDKNIMTFIANLQPQISNLKIVEIKRNSIIFIPSLDSLKQKTESTYYGNRRTTEYVERSSSRGAFLFLGILLMALGSLFIVLLIKLRSNHNRLRLQMVEHSKLPAYERMPNEEV